ncbi:hypothetical protein KIW84_052615 [Lathyrus oleraceus]|uniref:Retrovirus-related Pol polyprotein from transposon TNT 1-94-like beta-barrel domain-containing protein n=1 Tax=Pisum sativum TaxID=3888 RepID=A0A9D4WN46_PEA|nr:hypothetical protein KIW84_052615 [Pisum sativum]
MTGDLAIFDSYSPCQNNLTVRIANGTLSKVMGKGSVIISQNITLSSLLYVPKLDYNLLSISKLTKDLKCITKFFPNLSEFQILESGRTIGNDKECVGLYILQANTSKPESEATSCTIVSEYKTSEPTLEPNENAIENAESTRGPEEITSKNAEGIAVENAEDIAVETTTPKIEIAPRNK